MLIILTVQILQIIEIEFIAADRPTSPFNSSVKAGTAEPIGLNASKIKATLASYSNGRLKNTNAHTKAIPYLTSKIFTIVPI